MINLNFVISFYIYIYTRFQKGFHIERYITNCRQYCFGLLGLISAVLMSRMEVKLKKPPQMSRTCGTSKLCQSAQTSELASVRRERYIDRYILLFSCTCVRVHLIFTCYCLTCEKLGLTINYFFVGFFFFFFQFEKNLSF